MIRSFLDRAKTIEEDSREKVETWSLRVLALVIAGMGLINMMSLFRISLNRILNPFEQLSPFSIHPGEPLSTALLGFILIILADGLWRRKRNAWLIALLVITASTMGHIIDEPDYSKAVIATVLGMGILFLTPRYNVRSDQAYTKRALLALAVMFSITMVYGVSGFYLLRANHGGEFNLVESLHQSLVMFTQFYDPKVLDLSTYSRYFVYSVSTISAISLGYSLYLALLPVQIQNLPGEKEKKRARTIVQNHGRSSMARLTLLNDKYYFFTAGGSVISYTIQGRYVLVLGDPIGPDEDILRAITQFESLCKKNDWRPAYCLTMPDYLDHYRQAGFGTLCLGHEGIVDLDGFTLAGRANKTFRKRFNRLTEMGFRVEYYYPPVPSEIILPLREVSNEWLSMNGTTEKRFLLGSFDEEYIRSEPVAVVYTPEGHISAFANIITEYQRNEVTVDLMRRRRNAEPGTMDFLFVSLFQWAKSQGYDTFNIGLSPLYGVGTRPDTSPPERLIAYTYQYGNFFYDFKGLNEFKNKFHPHWTPQYLIYPGFANLPFVWLNMVRVNAGEQGSVWEYFLPKGKKRSAVLHN
jgi:phosphatidylglycerol lysyltransferase